MPAPWGVYLASAGYWLEENQAVGVFSGGVIRGDSDNLGEPYPPGDPRPGNRERSVAVTRAHSLFPHIDNEQIGFSIYDGLIVVENTSFQGFGVPPSGGFANPRDHAGGIGAAMYDNPWAIDPRNLVKGLSFDASTPANARFYWRSQVTSPPGDYPSGIRHTILSDRTGTVFNPNSAGVAFHSINAVLAAGLSAQGIGTALLPSQNARMLSTGTSPFDQPFAQVLLFHHETYWSLTLSLGTNSELAQCKTIPAIVKSWSTATPPVPDVDYNVQMLAWNVVTRSLAQQSAQPLFHEISQVPTPLFSDQGFTILVMGGHPGGVVDVKFPVTQGLGFDAVTQASDYAQKTNKTVVPAVASLASLQASTTTCFYRQTTPQDCVFLRVVIPMTADQKWQPLTIETTYGANFRGASVYVNFQ